MLIYWAIAMVAWCIVTIIVILNIENKKISKKEEPMCNLLLEMAEEEEREHTLADTFFDESLQGEILQIAMREIGMQNMHVKETPKAITYQEKENQRFSESILLKDYATGSFPSMADVSKENKYKNNSHSNSWDRNWERNKVNDQRPWANRFDDDDGVCRDPYAYYHGDWY